jgi:gas vesicle protein
MLPWIIGAVVVGVGAYLLDEEESNNRSAKKRHKREYDDSVTKIEESYEQAKRRDRRDKLNRAKEAKEVILKSLYSQLRDEEKALFLIEQNIKSSRYIVSEESMDFIVLSEKELISVKDGIEEGIEKLEVAIERVESEIREIEHSIMWG